MKLRLYRNSIRLRLSPADVEALMRDGEIREATRFGPDAEFAYCVILTVDADHPQAIFAGNRIDVVLPRDDAEEWAESQEAGIHYQQTLEGEKPLDILIEKDFECLETGQNQTGEKLYPNPKGTCP